MTKKLIIIILLIILLVFILVTHVFLFQEKEFNVGISKFDLPEGYYEGKINSDGAKNLTNGSHSIFINELNGTNVTQHVNEYKEYKESQNYVTISTNFTLDKTIVYKVDITNDTGNVHYWFVHNGKTYCIYSWVKNPKMDSITVDLIKSAGYIT